MARKWAKKAKTAKVAMKGIKAAVKPTWAKKQGKKKGKPAK